MVSLVRRRGLWASRLVAASGGLGVFACQTAEPPRPHVLLVTIDTTRADAVEPYGGPEGLTPALSRFAEQGVVFDNTMSVSPLTAPAHASLLTGRYPYDHGLRNNDGYVLEEAVPTLAEAFSAAGYQTGAFVSASVLSSDHGLDRGFGHYSDEMPDMNKRVPQVPQLPGAETLAGALRWANAAVVDSDAPLFLWVHFYDAHEPHTPPPRMLERTLDPYLAEVALVDEHVGALTEALEFATPGEDWVTAVVADHGESRGDHGEKTHGFFVYRSTLAVPFLLRGPGVPAGARVQTPVSSVDVAPTLAALAGLDWQAGTLDGRDLRATWAEGEGAAEGASEERLLYGETLVPAEAYGLSPLFVLQGDTDRVILAPRPERYRWRNDTGEQEDLGLSEPQQERLQAWLQEHPGAGELPQAGTEAAGLAALGYVASIPGGLGANLDLDPKDHTSLPDEVLGWVDAAHRMEPAQGAAFLEARSLEHPSIHHLRLSQIEAWLAADEPEEALRVLEGLDGLSSVQHTLHRASISLRSGDAQTAEALVAPLVSSEPALLAARLVHASALHVQGKSAAALSALQSGERPLRSARFATLEGALLLALEREQEAVRALRAALSLDPAALDAMELLAPLLLRSGWIDEGVRISQGALAIDPSALWAEVLLAEVAVAKGGCGLVADLLPRLRLAVSSGQTPTPELAACLSERS